MTPHEASIKLLTELKELNEYCKNPESNHSACDTLLLKFIEDIKPEYLDDNIAEEIKTEFYKTEKWYA